jgi:hypothetical protein
MMKKIIGIFICMLMMTGTLVGASSTPTDNHEIITQAGNLTVQIPVSTYTINQVASGQEISIQGYGHLAIPGEPNLPSKIFSIALPPGAILDDIVFETNDGMMLPGVYRIGPNPLPRVIGRENPALYSRDCQQYEENYQSVYRQNTPYPLSVGEVIGTGGYRKYNLVDVRITPVVYYPVSGTLFYYSDITVTAHYSFPKGFSAKDIMIDNNPRTEHIAQDVILNYEQAKNWYPTGPNGREQFDYVIITLDSLTSSVTSLVDWEALKGRSVSVVTTSWIDDNFQGYDLAAKMRAFLHERYPTDSWGIVDLCLIGGYDDVPMRRTAQDVGYGQPETDYYYAELSLPDDESWDKNENHQYGEDSDTIDFEAEINVGRIPWSDPDIVQSICEKSVAYELNAEDSFKKNILLLGAFFWDDTDNAVLMEYKTNPDHYAWMADWTKTRLYEDTQSSYPCDYDLNYNNVKSVWSAGTYAFVDWAGHGSETACYELYPSQPFVDEATCTSLNNDYPAIIFADACSNSDTDALNIGQAMLKQGGVGFLGATKVAYGMPAWNNPYSGSSQSLDCFFTTCVTSGEYSQGAAHQWALREMYTNNLWYYTKYEMFEWGALWGNPDLGMEAVSTSDPPLKPSTPVGKTLGCWNEEYSYTSSTTDPNGDQIYYLFTWGDGTSSGWLGPYNSGQTATGTHAWTALGNYSIVVRARDSTGAASKPSDPLLVTITDNVPPNEPSISGATNVKLNTPYDYTFVATDDFGQDVFFDIDWGDGNGAAALGPYHSGEEVVMTHTWRIKGPYTIKARAQDTVGAYSEWVTLGVTKPTVYQSPLLNLLEHLFERFPNIFPILRHLMGY